MMFVPLLLLLFPTPSTSTTPFLAGADVVAYFTLPESSPAVIGTSKFSTVYTSFDNFNSSQKLSTTFYFSTEENKDAFELSPTDYLPEYGGFCSYGVAFETIEAGGWPWSRHYVGAPGTPDIWKISPEGKLYIAFIPGAMDGFFAEWPVARDLADARWGEWWGEVSEAAPSTTTGPYNTECLGPPDVWAQHSCSNKPQEVDGVETIDVVSDDCKDVLEKHCHDVAPSTPGSPNILSSGCDDCIDDNWMILVAGGCEKNETSQYISNVVDKYYCK